MTYTRLAFPSSNNIQNTYINLMTVNYKDT